jgi:hypothetical protein
MDTNKAHRAHFGPVVDAEMDVDAQIVRLTKAPCVPYIKREETCCYALQARVRATDLDDRRLETYVVLDEVIDRAESAWCSVPSAAEQSAVVYGG